MDEILEQAKNKKRKTSSEIGDDEDEISDLEIDHDADLDFAHLSDEIQFGEQAYQPPKLNEAKGKVKKRHDNMLKRQNSLLTQQELDQRVEEQRVQRNLDMEREKVLARYRSKQLERVQKRDQTGRKDSQKHAQWQTFAARKSRE